MKKGLSLFGLLALSSFSSITNVFASDTFKATLEGGVKVSYSNSNTDLRATLLLKPNVTNDFSGEGISFRIKNHCSICHFDMMIKLIYFKYFPYKQY